MRTVGLVLLLPLLSSPAAAQTNDCARDDIREWLLQEANRQLGSQGRKVLDFDEPSTVRFDLVEPAVQCRYRALLQDGSSQRVFVSVMKNEAGRVLFWIVSE
jgi:hypothetical protein